MLFDHSLRCVDVRGLSSYGSLLSLYVLLVICPHIRAFNDFHVLLHNFYSSTVSILDARSFLQPQFFNHREQSWCPNVSLASVYSPHRIQQIDSHGEGDVTHYNQSYFLKGNKDRQYTCNVILKRFRATIVAVEKILYIMYMCL